MSSMNGARDQYLRTLESEGATTLRLIRAFPDSHLELKPAEKSSSARQLMWTFVMEQSLGLKAITEGFDWSKPPQSWPEPADSVAGIAAAFDDRRAAFAAKLKELPESALAGSVSFFTAPRTLGDVPLMSFLWMLLHDQIHHRGQLSVYLRLAGARVPSVYGPTADEPWM